MSKTKRTLVWSALDKSSNQLVRLIFGIFLARILAPTDYGLMGMMAIFLSIGDSIIDSGFSQALIQKKKTNDKDLSTVFLFNISISIIVYFIIFICSGTISKFFNQPVLSSLIKVYSSLLIFRSIYIVQRTLLIKELNFRSITKYNLVSSFLSGFIAVIFAFKNAGVWSLIIYALANDFILGIIYWIKSKWIPKFEFSWQSFRSLFNFGSKIFMAGILDNFFLNIYNVIIGKVFSASDLGLYRRGYGYRELITKNVTGVLHSSLFPLFSNISDNVEELKKSYKKIFEITYLIVTPILIIMIFVAEPLIRILITEKWLGAVPYLQLLCIAGLFYPAAAQQVSLIKAFGKSDTYLLLQFTNKIIIVIVILISIKYGIMALVGGQILIMYLTFLLGSIPVKRYVSFPIFEGHWIIIKYCLIILPVTLGFYFLIRLHIESDILFIVTMFFPSILVYLIIVKMLGFESLNVIHKSLKNPWI